MKVGIRYKQRERGAVGAKVEHCRHENWCTEGGWVWGGVSFSPLGEGAAPLPEILFAFGSQNGEFWCILSRIFTAELLVYRLRWHQALIRVLHVVVLAGTD